MTMRFNIILGCMGLLLFAGSAKGQAKEEGIFYRMYWYEPGLEHGNPSFNGKFRVNSPETSLHPTFGIRSEARGNGMMQILMEENILNLAGAELYLELWGGHPGTTNKRLSVNGRSQYSIPEVGTAQHNCTHQYPTLPLQITDLVNGYNVVQFAADKGSTFWGHFIVDNACLRIMPGPDDAMLKESGLSGKIFTVTAKPSGAERFTLGIEAPPDVLEKVASVTFLGLYDGYDENGDGEQRDWHGFTKNREYVAALGTNAQAPFSIEWNTAMLPEQDNMAVKAVVRFKQYPDLIYETTAVEGLRVDPRDKSRVFLYPVKQMPHPFWSRASRKNTASIVVDVDPGRIEKAELMIVVWDGGAGTVKDYFKLNGHHIPVAGQGKHDVMYSVIPIDASILKRGENTIELLSDTEHHGIEVLLPGPALMIRSRK